MDGDELSTFCYFVDCLLLATQRDWEDFAVRSLALVEGASPLFMKSAELACQVVHDGKTLAEIKDLITALKDSKWLPARYVYGTMSWAISNYECRRNRRICTCGC